MYYPCSENEGADQLCSYCTADLRLCFHTGEYPILSLRGLSDIVICQRKTTLLQFITERTYVFRLFAGILDLLVQIED